MADGNLKTGQVTVTGTAAALGTATQADVGGSVSIKAPLANAGPVYIGDSDVSITTGHCLDKGDAIEVEGVSLHRIYVRNAGGADVVTWAAEKSNA